MALSKVTAEALLKMSDVLGQSANDILSSKSEMDRQLKSFPWDDPVGWNFVTRYEEDFKPLTEKLIPNIKQYLEYIRSLSVDLDEYLSDRGGIGVGIGAGIAAAAAGVGAGIGIGMGSSRIHITGGENIESILPKGTPTDPIAIDPNAVPHIPNMPDPIDSEAEIIENVDSSRVEVDPLLNADFDSRISGMSKESLEYMEKNYQDYSDLSQISGYSYRDENSLPLPKGWEDMGEKDPNIQRIIDQIGIDGGNDSGLKFSVLKKTGEERYVIAFAGTDFPENIKELSQDIDFIRKDGRADLVGAFTQDEKQIQQAKDAVFRLCKEGNISIEQIEFTGHSLGGRLAAEMSVQYARPATTFNAAGVCEETRKQYEYLLAHPKNNYVGVRNIVTEHDPLSNIQSFMSGSKNPYIAALPKEKIRIAHETISGAISSPAGKVVKKIADTPWGSGTGAAIDIADGTLKWADRFNEYYNRDYRAIGGSVMLPDGQNDGFWGCSKDSHAIRMVNNLIQQRHQVILDKL